MAIWFQAMATKMESLFAELADYFVFDSQKYTLEEFMSDIKMFKNQFKVQLFFVEKGCFANRRIQFITLIKQVIWHLKRLYNF